MKKYRHYLVGDLQNGCHRTGMSRAFGQLQLNSLMLEKKPKIISKEIL